MRRMSTRVTMTVTVKPKANSTQNHRLSCVTSCGWLSVNISVTPDVCGRVLWANLSPFVGNLIKVLDTGPKCVMIDHPGMTIIFIKSFVREILRRITCIFSSLN